MNTEISLFKKTDPKFSIYTTPRFYDSSRSTISLLPTLSWITWDKIIYLYQSPISIYQKTKMILSIWVICTRISYFWVYFITDQKFVAFIFHLYHRYNPRNDCTITNNSLFDIVPLYFFSFFSGNRLIIFNKCNFIN